jgi:ABC-type spermidine/putrescine transport system permease subunit II
MAIPGPPASEPGASPPGRGPAVDRGAWRAGNGAGSVTVASGINFLAGLWFIISPWVFSYDHNGAAVWNSVVVGAVVAILALTRALGAYRATWMSWINALLGVWIFFSPWIFSDSQLRPAFWNSAIVGVLVFVLAAWSAAASSAATYEA